MPTPGGRPGFDKVGIHSLGDEMTGGQEARKRGRGEEARKRRVSEEEERERGRGE